MRNLKLQYCRETFISISGVKQILAFQLTGDNDETQIVVTQNKLFICRANEIPVEIIEVPDIIGAEYLTLDNEICVATAAGEVLLINPATLVEHEGTFCDVGIECMSWSPDQEVVVFVTKTHQIVVMTCTYDVLAEHTLFEECEGEGQFVNVGWGRKETQFHGTEGKLAANRKNAFIEPENVNDLSDDIEVSWRGDGMWFVVSFVCAHRGRMFKVFDKEGKLNFVSERVNGLLPGIAWRPSGTWIAVPQLVSNKSIIALFEKNGLHHCEIELPFDLKQENIISLKWNNDSDVLSLQTITNEEHRLYLYTINNYHWYIKQVLIYPNMDPIVVYQWDNRMDQEKTLHVLLTSGKLLTYRYYFGFDRFEHSGLVAVIDGKKLLLTNFTKAVIPPPMCHRELELDSYIYNFCLILDDCDNLELCVYTAQKELHIFKSNLLKPTNFKRYTVLSADQELRCQHLCNIHYFNAKYMIASHSTANNTKLMLLTINSVESNYKIQSTLIIKGTVNALTLGFSALDEFYVQTVQDGNMYKIYVTSENNLKLKYNYVELKQPADHIEWYTLKNDSNEGLISLCSNRSLYINSQHLSDGVTSFCIAGNYLVFTKLNSLHFLHLKDKHLVSERKIERGAKVVTTIISQSRIVLQLPRGNLETINPRILALENARNLLDCKSYNLAFDMLRKQRINLNIICDHNVRQFKESISLFLKQIINTNWLCLFLNDLRNEDYTKTMYSSNYDDNEENYPEGYNVTKKVNFVCELMCKEMNKNENERYHLPLITAFVKQGNIEQALLFIWKQKQSQEFRVKAEDLLKYLLYLVDVNELYNVALGTYDFGLVVFVAQRSQKDPKEYLPFLNELKSLDLKYRQFKIDEHLKRYEKALQNIAHCGANHTKEALHFIKKHKLYRSALQYYQGQNELYREICVAFGDELRDNGKLENASVMYERGGQLKQALLSARHVLDWRRVLALALKDKQNMSEVAETLALSLEENGRYKEAFELLRSYGKNSINAIKVLLKGKLYEQAIYEAAVLSTTENTLDTLIRNDLTNYANALLNSLNDDKVIFLDYKSRLLNIRHRRIFTGGNGFAADHVEVDEADLLSDTTSVYSSRYTGSSRGTGKTFRSSKNRRKHERKLLNLKPGNPFEDIALIDALYNLVTRFVQQQQHIHDICKALLQLQLDTFAFNVQREFKCLLQLVQESLDDIWLPELIRNGEIQYLTGQNIDYMSLQKEQRYVLIEPLKRFKPQLNLMDWEHDILMN